MIYFTKRKKQDRFCVKSKPAIRQRIFSYILRFMLSSVFLFYIGRFLFSFSRQDQSCPQKIQRRPAQHNAKTPAEYQ